MLIHCSMLEDQEHVDQMAHDIMVIIKNEL